MPNNTSDYFAACVFWLYIAAALGLTAKVLLILYDLPVMSKPDEGSLREQTWRYSMLAVLAFATLSFNMVNILLQSFWRWAQLHAVHYWSPMIFHDIWQWSLDTKPFKDFILDIFIDQYSVYMSVSALLATMALCLYMGVEGQRYKIPSLWAFFGLAQILPISFSSTLFFIAVIRSPKHSDRGIFPSSVFLLMTSSFTACIAAAIWLVWKQQRSPWLLTLVLVARLVLLVPLATGRAPAAHHEQRHDSWPAEALVHSIRTITAPVILLLIVAGRSSGLTGLLQQTLDRPALSTLTCDLVLAAGICEVWRRREQDRKSA